MTNRRQFVLAGVGASLAAGLSSSWVRTAAAAIDSNGLQFDAFVCDSRFAEARAAGGFMAGRGVPTLSYAGDLTYVWYDQLNLQWRESARTLGGVSTKQGLFVLETLAADYRMKVTVRALHGIPEGGCVRHRISGSQTLVNAATAFDASEAWPSQLWHSLAHTSDGEGRHAAEILTSAGAGERNQELVSWIIAPRVRPSTIHS